MLVRSQSLSEHVDYAYAAVAHTPARVVWTAGACPLDAGGGTVAVGDVAGQAAQVMDNLATALTDVVRTTVYVASSRQEDLVAAWQVVRARMGEHDAPSTLLGVAALGYEDQLVEVDAVAVLAEP